jgi:hypothetical protein
VSTTPPRDRRAVEVPGYFLALIPLVAALLGGVLAFAGSAFVARFQADQTAHEHTTDRRVEAYAQFTDASNMLATDMQANSLILGLYERDPQNTANREKSNQFQQATFGVGSVPEAFALLRDDEAALEKALRRVQMVGTPGAVLAAKTIHTLQGSMLLAFQYINVYLPGTEPSVSVNPDQAAYIKKMQKIVNKGDKLLPKLYDNFVKVAQSDTT